MKLAGMILALVVSVGVVGCALTGEDYDDALFITQKEPPGVVMKALYQGKVDLKGRCLRLSDSSDEPTVVWPYGSRLGGPAGQFIYSVDDKVIGQVGGEFRFGGGVVSTLWEEGPVAEDLRRQALAECPGKFWLIGQVLED